MITEAVLMMAERRAGSHALGIAGVDPEIPTDRRQRVLWGLLEVLDFGCLQRGDFNVDGVTEEEIKAYLLEHREEVFALPGPPSFIGLLAGTFDFLGTPP